MFALAIAAVLSMGNAQSVSNPNPSEEQFKVELRRKLAGCGVQPDRIEIEYVEDFQDYAVTISTPATQLDSHKYSCLARVTADVGQFISFRDEAATAQFWQARDEADRKAARQWLEQRGLLAKLPAFDPENQNLDSYARTLETFCGIEAGTVLVAASPSHLTMANLMNRQLGDDQFMCLLYATAVSNLRERGVFFGFIGNEAATEPNQAR